MMVSGPFRTTKQLRRFAASSATRCGLAEIARSELPVKAAISP